MTRRTQKCHSKIPKTNSKPDTLQITEIQATKENPAKVKDKIEIFDSIRKHRRYLSEFTSDIIVIDITHHQENEKSVFIEIDLGSQLISCVSPNSLYKEPRLITNFPGFSEAAKIAINNFITRKDKGAVRVAVGECWRTTLRIFAWMSRRNIFNLSDLTREMIDELMNDVALNGWAITLNQEEILNDFVEQARNNKELFTKLLERDKNSGNYTFPLSIFESLTGLPLNMWSISERTYRELAEIEGDSRPIKKARKTVNSQADAIQTLAWTLNSLSLSTPDSIKFYPFKSVAKVKKELIEKSRKASVLGSKNNNPSLTLNQVKKSSRPTINLTIHECIKLFTESAKWIYDYSPAILGAISTARIQLENIPQENRERQAQAWSNIAENYRNLASKFNLPIPELDTGLTRAKSLTRLAKMLQEACQDMLGICSARRPNEIIGRNRVPYGLYLGALVQVNDEPPIYCLDSYVSKGPQQWFNFPANILMVDAYRVLEKLYLLHEPYSKGDAEPISDLTEMRKRKIFTIRRLTTTCLTEGERTHSDLPREVFLRLAGVDPARFENTMTPFRRMFCVLHMFRYDLSEEPALQNYLGHFTQLTTQGYFRDINELSRGESIREIHHPDFIDIDLLREIENTRIEYTANQILLMLKGGEISGGFPVVVYKLAQKLSTNIDFLKLSEELQADMLARDLYKKGYRASPLEHTCCMGSLSKKANQTAKCFRDGSLHKEDASPSKCSGCINASTNKNSINRLKIERQKSIEQANNRNLPQSLVNAHINRANELALIISTEESISIKNKNLFLAAEENWKAILQDYITSHPTK